MSESKGEMRERGKKRRTCEKRTVKQKTGEGRKWKDKIT